MRQDDRLRPTACVRREEFDEGKEIAFNAGTHNKLIRLAYEDFAWLVQPRVVNFAAAKAA